MSSNRRLLLAATLAAIPTVASAQSYSLQRSNSIDLTGLFFGGATPSALGINPISVAFDGTTAWVGGYQNSTGSASIGVARISDVLTAAPTSAGLAGPGASLLASQFRGFTQMAALNGEVYLAYDINPGAPELGTPFIRKIDGTTGNQLWQVDNPSGGARPFAMAIDPRGGATDAGTLGVAGLAFMSQDPFVSGGSRFTLRLTDGAVVYGIGGLGGGGAGVFQTAGQPTGFSNRDIGFDELGNFLLSTGQGHSTANRTGDNSFQTFNVASPGAGSTGVLRKNESVVNGEGVAGAMIPQLGGGTSSLIAVSQRVSSGTLLTYTDQAGALQSNLNANHVHLRNRDGTFAGGALQAALTGGEDFFTADYSGQVKDISVGRDANGNPVIMVLSFADRRLDVYQVEPTFTAAGGDWDTAGNWNLGLIGNGATQNARFTGAGGAVTLNTAKTTKLLKLGGTGAYTFTGTGTLTTQAPTGRGAHIAVLSGSHTVNVPVIAASGTDLRVPTGSTLTLGAGISGTGATKRGLGEARVQNFRLSALNVAEGRLTVLANGGTLGASRAADLDIANTAGIYSATLDITNNGVVVGNGSTLADVKAAIVSGRAGGTWAGQGLTSSTAAANAATTAVGYGNAGALGLTSFLGISVNADETLVRYTRLGDANLSGTTEIGDFSLLAANFNTPGEWSNGDFNFDGSVDIGDFSLLAANFNQAAPGDLPRGAAVPEPAALSLIGLAALGVARRSRRA